MLSRRSLLGSLICAPAIIRTPGLLMPIKPLPKTQIVYTVTSVNLGDSGIAIPNGGFGYNRGDIITFDLMSDNEVRRVSVRDSYPFQAGDKVYLDEY